jgi:hypothetical protein
LLSSAAALNTFFSPFLQTRTNKTPAMQAENREKKRREKRKRKDRYIPNRISSKEKKRKSKDREEAFRFRPSK